MRSWRDACGLTALITEKVLKQFHQFREGTSTFGSLIQPVLDAGEITALRDAIARASAPADLLLEETRRKALLVLDQAEMLSQRYHVVVTNPPYMGGKSYGVSLKSFVEKNFHDAKSDLYACFIVRNLRLALPCGWVGMITIPNWMFLSSFAPLRASLLATGHIADLVHVGRGVWGSDFGSCCFVLNNWPDRDGLGEYRRFSRTPGMSIAMRS